MRNLLCALAVACTLTFAAEVSRSVTAKNVTQSLRFRSDALGEDRAFSIILPVDYESSTDRYPVLYLLHGYGDDNTAWSYMTNVSGYAATHRIIIVMPDASKSWYVNSAGDPKARFEDYIAGDLVAWVDSHYRTLPLRRARAIAGLSMGGYGAMFLGLKHATEFAAIGSFSGAVGIVHDSPDVARSPIEKEHAAEFDHVLGQAGTPSRQGHDPFLLLQKIPYPELPLIYMACGGEDFLLAQNRAFVALLAQKQIPYEYRETSPRVHSWDFWDDNIRIFLDLLDQLPGFGKPRYLPRD